MCWPWSSQSPGRAGKSISYVRGACRTSGRASCPALPGSSPASLRARSCTWSLGGCWNVHLPASLPNLPERDTLQHGQAHRGPAPGCSCTEWGLSNAQSHPCSSSNSRTDSCAPGAPPAQQLNAGDPLEPPEYPQTEAWTGTSRVLGSVSQLIPIYFPPNLTQAWSH